MTSGQFIQNIVPMLIAAAILFILLFSVYMTAKYRSAEHYKNTRINVFFSTLASVAIIFVGFNIILTSMTFEYNQRFTRISKTQEAVNKLWLYPNKLLMNNHHIRPEFLASFFMSDLDLYNLILLPNKKTPLTIEAIAEEEFIANVMVLTWKDCLSIRKIDKTPMTYWLVGFLTWAQNPYFKPYYERIKYEYSPPVVQLGDLLFEYAAKIPVPTIDRSIYLKTVKEMMNDPRFKSMLKLFDNINQINNEH